MKRLIEQLREYWSENGWSVLWLTGSAALAAFIIYQITTT